MSRDGLSKAHLPLLPFRTPFCTPSGRELGGSGGLLRMRNVESSRQRGRHLADPDPGGSPRRVTGWVVLVSLTLVLAAIAGTLIVTRSARQSGANGSGGGSAGGGCGGTRIPLEVVAA